MPKICICYFGTEFEAHAKVLQESLSNGSNEVELFDLDKQKTCKGAAPEQIVLLEHTENALLNTNKLIHENNPTDLKKLFERKNLSATQSYTLISCESGLIPNKQEKSYAQEFADLFSGTSITVRAPTIPIGAKSSIVKSSIYTTRYKTGKEDKSSIEFSTRMAVDDGIPALSGLNKDELARLNSHLNTRYQTDTLFTSTEANEIKTAAKKLQLDNKIETMLVFSVGSFRAFSELCNTYRPNKPSPQISIPIAVALNAIERTIKHLGEEQRKNHEELISLSKKETWSTQEQAQEVSLRAANKKLTTQINELISLKRKLSGSKFSNLDTTELAQIPGVSKINGLEDQIKRCCKQSGFSINDSASTPAESQTEKQDSTPQAPKYNTGTMKSLFIWFFGLGKIAEKFTTFYTENENKYQEKLNLAKQENKQEELVFTSIDIQSKLDNEDFNINLFITRKAHSRDGLVGIAKNLLDTKANKDAKTELARIDLSALTLDEKIKIISEPKYRFNEVMVQSIKNTIENLRNQLTSSDTEIDKVSNELTSQQQKISDIEAKLKPLKEDLIQCIDDYKPIFAATEKGKQKLAALALLKVCINNPDDNTAWENLSKYRKKHEAITEATFFSRVGYIFEKTDDFKARYQELKQKSKPLNEDQNHVIDKSFGM